MKKLFLSHIALFLRCVLTLSCDQESPCQTCENYTNAFVIGFDPCGASNPTSGMVGFVINIPSREDTVIAYNFPIGIYEFPEGYFSNRKNPFFPEQASLDFPIKIKYRDPRVDEEPNMGLCGGNYVPHPLFRNINEIILLSVIK